MGIKIPMKLITKEERLHKYDLVNSFDMNSV